MAENKIVIGIVGEIASGKGVAAKYLQDRYGGVVFKFSTVMRDVLKRLYVAQSRENLQSLSRILRQQFGEDLFAKSIAQDASGSDAPLIITDGIRRPSDITELAKLPEFHLVTITAPEEVRYLRVKNRAENPGDAEKSWEDFIKDSSAEPEAQIRTIAAQAQYAIKNDGTLEDLHRELDALIAIIRNTPA
jgi:dephospho-CoA kinase